LSFRGRRRRPRAWYLPSLAILALAALAPVPALAGEPVSDKAIDPSILRPNPVPEPRIQEPGQTPGYRLPFAAGQELRIEQGWNSTFSHNGKNAYAYDIGMPLGTDVLAAAAGLVAFTHDGETAPRLSQTRPDPDLLASYFDQVRDTLATLVQAGLVHGDLSAYNILAAGPRLVIIDLPQIVDLVGNANGMDFLLRDCANICGWFRGKGLEVDEQELFGELMAHAF